MSKTLKTLSAGVALAMGIALGPNAYAIDRAEMLANTCAGCHGPEGVSTGPAAPTIAGLPEEYFVEVMKEFQSGDRRSTIMQRIAKGYTDEDLQQMASYFAKQKFVAADQPFDQAKADAGAKLHKKYCEKCHSEGGKFPEEDSGILAGQWKPYLHATLDDFADGDSVAPKKMAKKLKKLLEKEGKEGLDKLVEFYASQK